MAEIRFSWICRNKQFNEISRVDLTDEQLLSGDRPSWITSLNCELIAKIRPTGQQDKNGKEIYEGDVLRHDVYDKARRWVVEYRIDSEYVGFLPVCPQDHKMGLVSTFMSWHGCEVIGNIYENPELLDKA